MSASERDHRDRTCRGKLRYADQHAALQALASCMLANWRGEPKRRELRAYECRHCGGWHLTSQEKRAA